MLARSHTTSCSNNLLNGPEFVCVFGSPAAVRGLDPSVPKYMGPCHINSVITVSVTPKELSSTACVHHIPCQPCCCEPLL